jgi:hypothetical protein
MSLTKLNTNMFDYSALVAGQTVTFSNTITTNSAAFSNTTSFAGTATFNGPVSISGTFTITGYSTFNSVNINTLNANNINANTIAVDNITANSSYGIAGQLLMSNGSSANNSWVDAPFMVHPFIVIGM